MLRSLIFFCYREGRGVGGGGDHELRPSDRTYENVITILLGAFAKLRKAIVSFVVFVCLSVCLHGIRRLPHDGFS